jgi:putative endonuclease
MSGGYIYILGSHTGTLYIGVTSNLYLRVMQHHRIHMQGRSTLSRLRHGVAPTW